MKIQRTTLFSLIGILLALTLACSFNASTAKVTQAFTARDVNGTFDQTNIFLQDEIFYLLVTLENAPDDTVTKAIWYAVDIEGTAKNTKLDETEFTSGDKITFNLSNAQLWPVGTYKVEVYLNDKLNQTLEFSVEGSAAATNTTTAATNTPTVAAAFDAYMASKSGGGYTQTDVFAANETFCLIVDLTSAPADTVSKVIWYAADVAGVTANTLIDETEFQGDGKVPFELKSSEPWPNGTYKVELYINNVLDRTVQFTVAETSGAAGGTTSDSGSVHITNAYIAREVNGKFERTTYYANDEDFHCYIELNQASPNTKFSVEWKAINVEGAAANKSLTISEGYSHSDGMVFDFSNHPNLWPKGQYSVDIYMDDVLQGSRDFNVN